MRFYLAILLSSFIFSAHAIDPQLRLVDNALNSPEGADFYVRKNKKVIGIYSGMLDMYLFDARKIDQLHFQKNNIILPQFEFPQEDELVGMQLIRMQLLGAKKVKPLAEEPYDEYYNYFLGNDASQWRSRVKAFKKITYPNIYEGVDWLVTSDGENLKHEFHVLPHHSPNQISWTYAGQSKWSINANGHLVLKVAYGALYEQKPICYQIINGKRIEIAAHFLLEQNKIRVVLEQAYNQNYTLVIDPVLIFSTYSGFTADNWGSAATPGEHGCLYSTGVTNLRSVGGTFNATPGSIQTTWGGNYDNAIFKYDSTGTKLLYATYLGGNYQESPHSMVMNDKNELLYLSSTTSSNFPTTSGAFNRVYHGGDLFAYNRLLGNFYPSDITLSKISSDGTTLIASTFFGGTASDGINFTESALLKNYGDSNRGDIITKGDNIYIASVTKSSDTNFKTSAKFINNYGGGITDGIVVCFKSDLSQVKWAMYIGGSAEDAAYSVQLDTNGDLYVAGGTASSNFPVTANAYQKKYLGNVDGWIAHIKPDGTGLVQATYTGTSYYNQNYFVDLDKDNNAFIYGQTIGTNFPITAGLYSNVNSGQFIQKYSPDLSTLIYSTVFGSGAGIPNISPTAFLVNDCGIIYVAGWGGVINGNHPDFNINFWNNPTTIGMPVTSDAYQANAYGNDFYLGAFSADGKTLLYGTFLGGSQSATHIDGGTCRFDKRGVVYHTVCAGCQAFNTNTYRNQSISSSDFPTTANAYSRVNGSKNCNNAAFKFDMNLLKASLQTNTKNLKNPGTISFCLGEIVALENLSFGGKEYEWLIDGKSFVVTNKNPIYYNFSKAGSYPVTLIARDKGTCIGESKAYGTIVIRNPTASIEPNKEYCINPSGTTINAYGGASYEWTWNNGANTANTASVRVFPLVDTEYDVKVIDPTGCLFTGTQKITALPTVTIKWNVSFEANCFNSSIVHLNNLSDPAENVVWDLGNGETSTTRKLDYEYPQDGVYTIQLIGTKGKCVTKKDTTLAVFKVTAPNVITPAIEDGKNDLFVVNYPEKEYHPDKKVALIITNRWGKTVFKSDDYQNDWSGEKTSGVYYYEIVIEGNKSCKGWVEVIGN